VVSICPCYKKEVARFHLAYYSLSHGDAQGSTGNLEIDMARFTIKTRINGDMDFWVRDEGGYVRLESDGCPGTLGRQICDGGGFRGSTIMADAQSLEAKARRWYRAYRALQRQHDFV
jgi:hypothetical protein